MELTKEQLMQLYKSSQSDPKKTQELYDSGYQVAANFMPAGAASKFFKSAVSSMSGVGKSPMANYFLANKMKNSGKTSQKIWEDTGLFFRHGKWMTEMNNEGYRFNQIKHGDTKKLSDVIKDVDYIKEGPLKDISVTHKPDVYDAGEIGYGDGYYASHNTFRDGSRGIDLYSPKKTDDFMNNIRLDSEGKPFPDPSGTSDLKPNQGQLNEIFNSNYKQDHRLGPKVFHEIQHELQKLFNMQSGSSAGPIERQIVNILHPTFGVIAQREKWLRQKINTPKYAKSLRQKTWKTELDNLNEMKKALGVSYKEDPTTEQNSLKKVAEWIYERTTGEVDAHSVQARANMTKEARKKLVPFKDEKGVLYRNKSDQGINNYGLDGENSDDLIKDYLKKKGFRLPSNTKFKL